MDENEMNSMEPEIIDFEDEDLAQKLVEIFNTKMADEEKEEE